MGKITGNTTATTSVVDGVLSTESKNAIQNKVVAEKFNEVFDKLGDTEAALDNIIAIQNSLIGGGSK